MRKIGLHIRYPGSLTALIEKALARQVPFFQCFLVSKDTGRLIEPTQEDSDYFLTQRRTHFHELFVHGSYWINLAGIAYTGHKSLYRELEMAQRLEFTHMILHPGSAKGATTKAEGIDALARAINTVMRKKFTIRLVLENTAHGNLSVGGDLQDFNALLQKLDNPDAVAFCIDTAHAYSYGYDIARAEGLKSFINQIESCIGMERVILLHINDTLQSCGSKVDKHCMVGEGNLGIEALKAFMQEPCLQKIPALLELPVVSDQQEQKMLEMVREW